MKNIYFILHGIVVGLMTGITVGLFKYMIENISKLFTYLYKNAAQNSIYIVFIIIILSLFLLIISSMIKKQPHIMGSGIPEVEGQLSNQLTLTGWPILWRKFISGALAIGSGAFLGREGPSIQLGAEVAQIYTNNNHFSKHNQRIMIASGAASGLSAAFNAPIAGTLFVLEEVYHNFSPTIWIGALSASITSDIVSLYFFGLNPILFINHLATYPLSLYYHLIILGIIIGFAAILYQKVLLKMGTYYQKIFSFIPRYLHGFFPFLLLIPIGISFPNYLGGGNQIIVNLYHQIPSLKFILVILILRFIFSMISYGSGLPGGIFLPILTIGSLIGTVYGLIMLNFNLIPSVYISDLIIFSMSAYFASISKAPFTAILLITEMVGSLQHLVPLAITSLVAYSIVDLLNGEPIYDSLLKKMMKKD